MNSIEDEHSTRLGHTPFGRLYRTTSEAVQSTTNDGHDQTALFEMRCPPPCHHSFSFCYLSLSCPYRNKTCFEDQHGPSAPLGATTLHQSTPMTMGTTASPTATLAPCQLCRISRSSPGSPAAYSVRPPPNSLRMKPPIQSTNTNLRKVFTQFPSLAAPRPAEWIEVGVAAR